MKIYCVVNNGNSIDEQIAELLFEAAQRLFDDKGKKARLINKSMNLTGIVATENKFGNVGSIFGIIFNAEFDWDGGSTKIEFIAKPVSNEDKQKKFKWRRASLFPHHPSLNRN